MSLKNKLCHIPVLLLSVMVFAQRGPGRERIKTLKVAFITEQLDLSSKEAQRFWPVYNAHEDALEAIRKEERQRFGGRLGDMEGLGGREADGLLESFTKIQAEKHTLEQDFIKELKGVIPSVKIIKLLRAEENFKKRLLQQFRKRRGGGR